MADTTTFRIDEDVARALTVLTSDGGTSDSSAVRSALIDAARARARAELRAEAEVLAANDSDRAEAAQVLRDMAELRAWLGLSAASRWWCSPMTSAVHLAGRSDIDLCLAGDLPT